jgi:hypothetical protein
MRGKSPNQQQLIFCWQNLADQLNPKHPLYRLANATPWDVLEKGFAKHFRTLDGKHTPCV